MSRVSLIVPAHNAEATLGATLDAVAAQDFAGDVELVVVDDASSDGTADLADGRGVRVVRRPECGGAAAARNSGIEATSAPLIAFTDADCEPTPGWLSALVGALDDADLATGPVAPDPRVNAGPFDKTLSFGEESYLFETANLAVRRSVAERLGGFAPFAAGPGAPRGLVPQPGEGPFGEDARFGWGALREGARVVFAPEALVHHAVFPRPPAGYLRERWRMRYFPTLVRELPELRERMTARVFLSPRTARFDLALVGVAAAVGTRRPWPLVAVVPYARTALWRRPLSPWLVRTNAYLVVGDAVGLAALVRGSVAARRVLL